MSALKIEDLEEGVRLLTLNRPRVNALDLVLMGALCDAIDDAESDVNTRSVVITGAGETFSAGLDFKAMLASQMSGESDVFFEQAERCFSTLWRCKKPTIAAVNGHAIAGGFLILAACDLRVVKSGPGSYGLNELLFGAGFPPIAIEIGRYIMGHQFARAILTGRCFGWKEGLANGVFTHAVEPDADLIERALILARAQGKLPQPAYAHVKAQLLAPHLQCVEEESAEHRLKTREIYTSPETAQAMMRYMTKVLGSS